MEKVKRKNEVKNEVKRERKVVPMIVQGRSFKGTGSFEDLMLFLLNNALKNNVVIFPQNSKIIVNK